MLTCLLGSTFLILLKFNKENFSGLRSRSVSVNRDTTVDGKEISTLPNIRIKVLKCYIIER